MKLCKCFLILLVYLSCRDSRTKLKPDKPDTARRSAISDSTSILKNRSNTLTNDTGYKVQIEKLNVPTVSRHELVRYAKTLIGISYKFASSDPSEGFDCSGFITYVFSHFHWVVPRSSVDFTNVGKQINLVNATEGDLILFTGTSDSIKIVGHMGIITENTDTLRFIHSTSGRAHGVTISNLSDHYRKRFVKVIRIFSE
jgi:cell wall-associated NlpC family hydrolase